MEEDDLTVVEPTINILNREETWSSSDSKEKHANAFAAELLMPEEKIREFFDVTANGEINMTLIK